MVTQKNVLKKLLAGACAVSLILSSAACASSKTGTTPDQKNTQTATEAPAEKITYQFYTNAIAANYPTDGGVGKKLILEKAAQAGIKNFDFNITMLGGNDYFDKLNILAASNQLPDLFNINTLTANKFSGQKLILALDDLIKKNIPNETKYASKSDMGNFTFNGSQYAIASTYRPEGFNSPNVNCFIIRKDWLDNLGMKVPTTIDEFYEVLKAFTQKDPDKNGKNDTYGLTGNKDQTMQGIFGAYGVIPYFWMERDGMLKYGSVLPECKDALTTLAKWYKEGLINPFFITNDGTISDQDFYNSKAGIVYKQAFDADPAGGTIATMRKLVPTVNIEALHAPKGPNGLQGYPENTPGGKAVAIASTCKNPDLLSKYINFILDIDPDKGAMLLQFGTLGQDYTFDKDKNAIKQITSNNDLIPLGLSNTPRMVQVTDRRWMAPEGLVAMNAAGKYIIQNKFWTQIPEITNNPDIFAYPPTNPKLFMEYFAKIITGTVPVSAYDEYVKKFYQMGGKAAEDKVNELYKKTK